MVAINLGKIQEKQGIYEISRSLKHLTTFVVRYVGGLSGVTIELELDDNEPDTVWMSY